MSVMSDAIAAHRAVWQAFQDAPDEVNKSEFWRHTDDDCEAEHELVNVIPESADDLAALKSYLDWWVIEEAQRKERAPQLFALHSAIVLAMKAGFEDALQIISRVAS